MSQVLELKKYFAGQGHSPEGEEWQFTDITPVLETPFNAPPKSDHGLLKSLAQGPLRALQITFVDGSFAPELSTIPADNGLTVKFKANQIGRTIDATKNAFADLNAASHTIAAVIVLSKGAQIADPIHVLFLSSHGQEPFVVHPRVLILAEEGSRANVVESAIGSVGGVYLTNAVTEIFLREGAFLDYTKVQRESKDAFHFSAVQVTQGRNSTFASHSISLGGRIARYDIGVMLDGEGADCTLNGLYEVTGNQLVDHHTLIDHAKPNGTSRELFKGILDGKSRGVFDGKIIVRHGAQKTNASQTNRNLLLSKEALVNTKPELQIFADDVKCRHGATIGHLDQNVMFYLRSRGIGIEDARRILVHAFASEIVDQIGAQAIRSQLGGCLAIMAPGVKS